jgi:hypothetical protein
MPDWERALVIKQDGSIENYTPSGEVISRVILFDEDGLLTTVSGSKTVWTEGGKDYPEFQMPPAQQLDLLKVLTSR